MTADELRTRFPNASEQFIAANANPCSHGRGCHPHGPPPAAEPERDSAHEPLAAPPAEARDPGFYVVRLASFRTRLCDTDNLVPKFHVDALRYAGVLPSDAPDRALIITTQSKVARRADERTEITIERVLQPP